MRSTPTLTRRAAAVALAGALALGAAACSSDDGGDDAATDDTEMTEPAGDTATDMSMMPTES
ncbi:hypothetical protein [Salsipaludibacter albus]|uniref:hypothetical protein n=1 Tax=Salsipaludibacter albus TaxID=2849650 RepID=UPI001EE48479|nr:hypothetical protein [Salsipaludibacter albus]MBY5161554.1 hypothetical protein [Salsipaludibacter albus]